VENAENTKNSSEQILPLEQIEQWICFVRGQKVMLDSDLAALYQVPTKALNQAVRRNLERFPWDFCFVLSKEEAKMIQNSRSQIVTLKVGKNVKYLPFAFTEQGVAMLSSVLRSKRAVQVNIEIMRAFVRLRQMLASNADLARQLATLEKKYDQQFKIVFDAIRELMNPSGPQKKREIGFHAIPTQHNTEPIPKLS
jgi:hypothetical protein